jgi:hypothetical protein
MMTLFETKNLISQENGYEDFKYVVQNLSIAQIVAITDEVARRYAADQLTALGNDLLSDIRTNLN